MSDASNDRDGFRIHKIPISGAAGALVVLGGIAILVVGVPPLRVFALCAIAGGVVFACARWIVRR